LCAKAGDGLSVKASAQRSLSDDLTFGSFGQAKEQSHSGKRLKRQVERYIINHFTYTIIFCLILPIQKIRVQTGLSDTYRFNRSLPLRATSFVLKQKKQKFKPLERLFAAQGLCPSKAGYTVRRRTTQPPLFSPKLFHRQAFAQFCTCLVKISYLLNCSVFSFFRQQISFG